MNVYFKIVRVNKQFEAVEMGGVSVVLRVATHSDRLFKLIARTKPLLSNHRRPLLGFKAAM